LFRVIGMIRELAFKAICGRYSDEVYRYARSMLGNGADAEDATQEVLLRLWENLSLISVLKVRAWLYRTTRNYCLDQIRRRDSVVAPVLVEGAELEAVGGGGDPSREVDLGQLRRRVDQALQGLPERLRSVFILYEINGLRYREIAAQLEIPINSVKVHLLRARKRLQEELRKEGVWTS